MSLVRVHNLSVSLDGFVAGEGLSTDAPFGHAGFTLHQWMFDSDTVPDGGHRIPAPVGGVDRAFAARYSEGIGAEIMGRRKFGPQQGPWTDEQWRGWWGENPPFHTPVFVLTHHPRPSLEMEGGTVFHFVQGPPHEVLAMAREAAGDLDVQVGGGAATWRDYLAADLVDHLHVVVVPVLLGRGERVWEGLEGLQERFSVETVAAPSGVAHLTFTRRPR